MKKPLVPPRDVLPDLPPLPGWILANSGKTLDVAMFCSGAALAHLGFARNVPGLPEALWRARLAVSAAAFCVGLAGRSDGAGQLRDALHLTQPGDDPGPGGRVLRQWSQAVARPVSVTGLARVLEGMSPARIAHCLDTPGATPVDRAAQVIEDVLSDTPRGETSALILAEAVLAKSGGASHILPLLSLALSAREMHLRGAGLRLACHRALVKGVAIALPQAAHLMRAASRLRALVPQLRAKGAEQAVEMFLMADALSPVALARAVPGSLSEHAARRLCKRLVELGGVRELTGRDTFRLYGV